MSSAPSTNLGSGRLLLSLVGVFTSTACYWADFNDTHIYNPKWTPHAKFHTGQTMSLGMSLGLLTLYHLWRRDPAYNLSSAFTSYLLACTYWATQISAFFYPQVQAVDPPAGPWEFPQMAPSSVCIALSSLGYWLERRRLLRGGRKAE